MTDFLDGSPAVINVDGFTFNQLDDDGVKWTLDKVSGWHDGPSVKVEQEQRIVSHGQFAQPGHRGGRTITMSGMLMAHTRGPLAAATQRLATILGDGGFGTFEFIDADHITLWTPVQLLQTPDMSWDGDPLTVRYQLSFVAPSAYRFGAISSGSTDFAATPSGVGLVFPPFDAGVIDFGASADVGQVAVTNYGTASAPVVFTITGPTPTNGFVITDTVTGKRIQYLGQVPDGSTLVIDCGAGSVIIDGTADRLGDTIVTEWVTLPAGETRAFLFEPNGATTSSTLTAEVTSTYW